MKPLKIIYATDLHGNTQKYDKIFAIVNKHKADYVINGADFMPKGGNMFLAQKHWVHGYFKIFSKRWRDGLHKSKYLFMSGNDDLACLDGDLKDWSDDFIYMVNDTLYQHNSPHSKIDALFGCFNMVPDYPFRLKDRCHRDLKTDEFLKFQYGTGVTSINAPRTTPYNHGTYEYESWLNEYRLRPSMEEIFELSPFTDCLLNNRPSISVLVCHAPPYNSGLGVLLSGEDVGSKAVKDYIQQYQPTISLHGHIHESYKMTGQWKTNIGDTVAINQGPDHYVLITINSAKDIEYEVYPFFK